MDDTTTSKPAQQPSPLDQALAAAAAAVTAPMPSASDLTAFGVLALVETLQNAADLLNQRDEDRGRDGFASDAKDTLIAQQERELADLRARNQEGAQQVTEALAQIDTLQRAIDETRPHLVYVLGGTWPQENDSTFGRTLRKLAALVSDQHDQQSAELTRLRRKIVTYETTLATALEDVGELRTTETIIDRAAEVIRDRPDLLRRQADSIIETRGALLQALGLPVVGEDDRTRGKSLPDVARLLAGKLSNLVAPDDPHLAQALMNLRGDSPVFAALADGHTPGQIIDKLHSLYRQVESQLTAERAWVHRIRKHLRKASKEIGY